MCKVRLVVVILSILFSILSLSCGTGGDAANSRTPLFPLIPHEPGEPPLVPHPQQSFQDCVLCHIDTSNVGSSIKILGEHSCNECHDVILDIGYNGPCYEVEPVNSSCILDVCHLYP